MAEEGRAGSRLGPEAGGRGRAESEGPVNDQGIPGGALFSMGACLTPPISLRKRLLFFAPKHNDDRTENQGIPLSPLLAPGLLF